MMGLGLWSESWYSRAIGVMITEGRGFWCGLDREWSFGGLFSFFEVGNVSQGLDWFFVH